MTSFTRRATERARIGRPGAPHPTAGREVPQAAGGEVPRTSEPAQAASPTARTAKRRDAKKGPSKKRT